MSTIIDPRIVTNYDGSTAIISLNYAEKRNALDVPMREALFHALTAANDDPDCRAIVLTGYGDNFCAGGDVTSMSDVSAAQGRWRVRHIGRIATAIIESPKLVITAVEGFASGAGLSLAAASDVVVASSTAKFLAPFGRLGLMPDTGVIFTLPKRVGLGRAKSILLTGRMVDADEALAIGLADFVTEPAQALDKAMDIARGAGDMAPLSISFTKSLLARAPQSLADHIAAEADAQGILFATEDFAEGRTAFLEKRKPLFRGV